MLTQSSWCCGQDAEKDSSVDLEFGLELLMRPGCQGASAAARIYLFPVAWSGKAENGL